MGCVLQALQRTEETLGKAQALLGQLSGEKTRWDRQVQEMRRAVTALPAQMMLAAGFCTYLSKTPEVWDPRYVLRRSQSRLIHCGCADPLSTPLSAPCWSRCVPQDVRASATQEWLDICRLDAGSFDILKLLGTESDMLTWKADGLPSDSLSMQVRLACVCLSYHRLVVCVAGCVPARPSRTRGLHCERHHVAR